MHDTNFFFESRTFLLRFRLNELKNNNLSISVSRATEDSRETSSRFPAHNSIVLTGILFLNIGSVSNLSVNFAAVLELLLRRVELSEDDFKQSAWVISDLIIAEDI